MLGIVRAQGREEREEGRAGNEKKEIFFFRSKKRGFRRMSPGKETANSKEGTVGE